MKPILERLTATLSNMSRGPAFPAVRKLPLFSLLLAGQSGFAAVNTIWPGTAVPGLVDGGADSPVELGVKFRSDSAGSITGIRFYKATANTGTHVGNLWSTSGTLLGSVTFSNETASGWQQMLFTTPVAIASNTVYVASYHANNGHYSADINYFLSNGVNNPPLHALTNGVSGGNGVYAYGSTSGFPNQTWNSANYWVDVVFQPAVVPTLNSISLTPTNQTILTGTGQQFAAAGNYSDGSTQNLSGQVAWTSSTTSVASINATGLATGLAAGSTTISGTLGTVSGRTTLTVQTGPLSITTSSLTNGTVGAAYSATLSANGGTLPYTWSVAAGALPAGLTLNPSNGAITGIPTAVGVSNFTVQIADVSSPAQTATRALSITIAAQPTTASIWPSTALPALADAGPDSAVELGVKFRSDVAGSITGIRFYKAAANTGAHVGNLWTSAGSLLGSVTFTGESASGWQQMLFATPLAIASNTIYVASYHANNGHYSGDLNYFLSNGVNNPPLHALTNGASGGNGVYVYGSISSFPNQTYNSANYWVDVVFQPAAAPTLSSIAVTPSNQTIMSGAGQQFTATGTYSDGSTQNLSSQVTWASSNLATATISASGLAAGLAAGTTTISATLSGVLGTAVLTVKAPPTLTAIAVAPTNPAVLVGATQQFTATGTYSDGSTSNLTSQATWASSSPPVATISTGGLATGVSAGTSTISATLAGLGGGTTLSVQTAPLTMITTSLPNAAPNLPYSTTLAASGGTLPYIWSLASGALPPGLALNPASGVISGTPTTVGTSSFTAQVSDASSPVQTVARAFSVAVSATLTTPILVVTNAANPFSQYCVEILLTEGMNEFDRMDISAVSSAALAQYDVVILGQTALTSAQVSLLSNWVNAGGKLIAMRPDKQLAGLLGLVDAGSSLANAYLLVNTASGPGAGIVGQTIQFHGTADRYTLGAAASLATLYASAQTSTVNPAVTLCSVGPNGGQAAAFTFDLARSVVYTRQGNPAWSGQERDGITPIRSDDLFFGAASSDPQPDWVDLNKVAIPQADEQQRLLANLITFMDANRKLLPRFWYFPYGYQAVVVMTGDDHANGGTAGRFDHYKSLSPANSSVTNWTAIRGTSYIYPGTPLTDASAASYTAAGFELSLHLNTGCADWTRSTLTSYFTGQLSQLKAAFPSLPAPTTHRIHCIVWSDYSTAAEVGLQFGIRLDASYYYWPASWILDRPGMFTGSGMPMRFSKLDGTVIDAYQAPTQMTDESGQSFPYHPDLLLDGALGPQGFYGAFVANMHTDYVDSPGSDAIVKAAMNRGVPVISSRQLLTWLDARNGSFIKSNNWVNSTQLFSIAAAPGGSGLQVMLPVPGGYAVSTAKYNGNPVAYYLRGVKGIQYAFLPAFTGDYQVSYVPDTAPPTVSATVPANGSLGVNPLTAVTVSFNEVIAPSTANAGSILLRDSLGNPVPATISYNPSTLAALLIPTAPLGLSKTYTATVKGGASGVTDLAGNAPSSDLTWSFTTTNRLSLWPSTDEPVVADAGPDSAVELGVKFRSDTAGRILGIRFYKSNDNTGTHVGNLWSSTGSLLASATFAGESASGWQQVNFATPLAISANTVYVASYHCNTGHYSLDAGYFSTAGVDSTPLHAPANGASGGNGVYRYTSNSAFPNQTYGSDNYWVDIVFTSP